MVDQKSDAGRDRRSGSSSSVLAVARVRSNVARVLWVCCLLIALVLAFAAFSFALKANEGNDLVTLIRDLADFFDLGFFDLENPVKAFGEPNGEVKTALFNYGIAAVVYLVIGRFVERIVRP